MNKLLGSINCKILNLPESSPIILKKYQNPMNVLHISGATSWGGNEQQLIYLINELQNYEVNQYMLCFKDTKLLSEASTLKIEIHSVNVMKSYNLRYLKILREEVVKNQIDIIHLHTSNAVTAYVLCDRLYRLKTPTIFARKSIRRKMSYLSKQKYNYKNIDRILCISKYVEDNFKKELSPETHKKFVIVNNGVKKPISNDLPEFDLRKKLNIGTEIFLIGNIANHTQAKDLPTLIKTIETLVKQKRFTNFHLVQMGEYSSRTEELKNMVRELNLEKYVTFLGFTPNASILQKQMDVFVMTSEREGGPSSVVEAFYNRTAVISTKVGIIDEVIVDGVTGFKVEVGDYQALATKIIELANNPELKEQFRERSLKLYHDRFTSEMLGKNTLEVYKNINMSFRN